MNKVIAIIILCVASATLSSCNIIAGVTYLVTPDPEQLARYDLPDVRAVVFIDDRRNVMPPIRLRRVIADRVTNDLLTKNVLTTIISPTDVMRVSAQHDRHNAPLSVAELGRAVDASIVIYVEMSTFTLTSDRQTADPRAGCFIRVIDVENETRLFPTDKAAFPVTISLKRIDPHRIASAGERRKLEEQLAGELGDAIAKVFYRHNTGRLGENLNRK